MPKDKENQAEKHVYIPPETDLNGDTKLIRLEASLREMADFRFNTITRFPEIRYKNSKAWKRLDDFRLNSMVRALKKRGTPYAFKTRVSELLESDFSEKVNPIKAYFDNLKPVSDDPIGRMTSTITLAGDPNMKDQQDEMFRTFFTKWLVGAVANIYITDKCANQQCFIIAGPQGTFKSTWIRNLCPKALSDYYIEGSLDPDNKDSILATATNFIFNLDDYFAGITARKINEFKGLLTKNTVKIRRAYARYSEELSKVCSFIASSNEAQFLHDPTGSRRFLPFEVQAIDINAAQAISIDDLWSQASQLFKSGYTYWLSKEDQDRLNEYNSQFEVQSNEYEVLVTYMQPPKEGELPEADLTNAEILAHLQEKVSLKLSAKKVGEALRKAGFPRYQKRRGGGRSWVYGINYADEADIYTGRQPSMPGSSLESEEGA
ncbi:MAG: virulence protein [Cyanothece sp. SIO1E1]|nr:virulence protein [Cyanothece sp. SIO1E1]